MPGQQENSIEGKTEELIPLAGTNPLLMKRATQKMDSIPTTLPIPGSSYKKSDKDKVDTRDQGNLQSRRNRSIFFIKP